MSLLTINERDLLRQEVALFMIGNPAKLTTVIPSQHFIRIKSDAVPEEYAQNVLTYCEMSAWVEEPALIIQLLKKFALFPPIQAAILRLQSGQPPRFHIPPKIWDTILLALDLPFMNREKTREAMEYFTYPLLAGAKPAGVRALVVKGPEKSGKTFTYDYIRYVTSFLGNANFKTIWVDLKKQAISRFGPKHLAISLLEQINPNWQADQVHIPELDAQQPARWIIELCSMLAEQIVNTGVKHIIVLDGLDDRKKTTQPEEFQPLPRETIDMILQLVAIATGAEKPEISEDQLRVVLLGFEQPVVNHKNRVRFDNIESLTQNDIRKYFVNYAGFHQKEIDEEGLTDMVDTVFEEDDPNDPDRTRKLAQKALEVAKAIIQI
ncbi:hypothetical protein [Paraflavitalea sp. CAU 1676]|uniref:hypothetical protein n=1 Tax=Paraflavitalea sp. CAU 1676 TaxID=3032598 RepID=UPI0023DC049A|nr:hypothetical protein [Paraflavitalea sp. CAU 1676]MDF2188441.1 hypothetical protein [Paraflavitalea sp. CAU 1676]